MFLSSCRTLVNLWHDHGEVEDSAHGIQENWEPRLKSSRRTATYGHKGDIFKVPSAAMQTYAKGPYMRLTFAQDRPSRPPIAELIEQQLRTWAIQCTTCHPWSPMVTHSMDSMVTHFLTHSDWRCRGAIPAPWREP